MAGQGRAQRASAAAVASSDATRTTECVAAMSLLAVSSGIGRRGSPLATSVRSRYSGVDPATRRPLAQTPVICSGRLSTAMSASGSAATVMTSAS